MPDRLRIFIVNNYTGRGGIPKAVADLANAMHGRGHKITIISQKPVPKWCYPLYRLGHKINELSLAPGRRAPLPLGKEWLADMYPLAPGIELIPYSFSDNNLKIQKLRKQLMALNPDVCVCPLPDGAHMVWAATLLGTGIPYVYSERTSPKAIENVFWCRRGRLAAMSGADAIHLLLPGFAESIPNFLKGRVAVIPNAVTVPEKKANISGRPGKKKRLLWLGRLFEEAKQCRLAVDAFASVAAKFPDWEMRIVGDGPDQALIKKYVDQCRLSNRIVLAGECKDPLNEYLKAQAFCFSSRMEGMPNALLEAMAAGLPCVAFAHCQGLSDIIEDGQTGMLAQEMMVESMAQNLSAIMGDESLRLRLGESARQSMATYAHEKIADAWEALLIRAAAKKGDTVLDGFNREPFASMARMAHRGMQEWALRDFGQPMPGSFEHRLRKLSSHFKNVFTAFARKMGSQV